MTIRSHDELELVERDLASLLLVVRHEPLLQQTSDELDLALINHFKGLRVRLIGCRTILQLVPGVNDLDHADARFEELMPVNLFILVLVGHRDEHVDIVVVEAVSEELERVTELRVGQTVAVVLVDHCEHGLEGALQSADETGRLDVGNLRLLTLTVKVLHLADIEGRNERIDLLSLIIDKSRQFEFSTEMQDGLDLKLLLEQLVDPRLE